MLDITCIIKYINELGNYKKFYLNSEITKFLAYSIHIAVFGLALRYKFRGGGGLFYCSMLKPMILRI